MLRDIRDELLRPSVHNLKIIPSKNDTEDKFNTFITTIQALREECIIEETEASENLKLLRSERILVCR